MSEPTTCAKCGACVTVCPVARISGRESHSARGRIHLIENLPETERTREFGNIFFNCLLCGACKEVCPRHLDIPALIVAARSELPPGSGRNPFEKYLAAQALASPALLAGLSKLGRFISLLPAESGLRLKLAGFMAIEPQSPPPSTRRHTDHDNTPATAAYFPGCAARHLYPAIAADSKLIIDTCSGAPPLVPENQVCCGLAAYAAGDLATARELAIKNIKAFTDDDSVADDMPILVSCGSCLSHLKSYETLLADEPEWMDAARAFSARVTDLFSYAEKSPKFLALLAEARKSKTPKHIFYHQPCHLRFHPEAAAAPRHLIAALDGFKLQEPADGQLCCGHGGLFRLEHPQESTKIFARLAGEFEQLEADMVTTTCSGCLLQWQERLGPNSPVKVVHLASLLAELLHPRHP